MYRMLLIASVTVVTTATIGQAQTMSVACAERDVQAIAFVLSAAQTAEWVGP
jgi:hypothetical protein